MDSLNIGWYDIRRDTNISSVLWQTFKYFFKRKPHKLVNFAFSRYGSRLTTVYFYTLNEI